jgi:predicted RNA-binding protein
MCEANAYFYRNEQEELILESVNVIEPQEHGGFLLIDIFGTQKVIEARLKGIALVDHKILFEK